MVGPMTRELVVKVTCGIDSPERANQGFTVAATAASAGATVSLWLTGEGVWLATPERGSELALPLATPVPDLLATVLELGTVTVCSQCAARRLLTEEHLVPGVRIAGAPVFVEEALRDTAQALVY
jgi:predicted peroxiredoxin